MMPSKLILGVRLAGRQLAVVVIHQDESLRRTAAGRPPGDLWRRDKLRIASSLTPSLGSDEDGVDLYVRGEDRRADRNICIWEFETEEEARYICDLIREGVRAINAVPDAEPADTFAGFEIVK